MFQGRDYTNSDIVRWVRGRPVKDCHYLLMVKGHILVMLILNYDRIVNKTIEVVEAHHFVVNIILFPLLTK